MTKKTDRSVFKTGEGWANKSNSATRAAGVHPTQREAINEAREMLNRAGGGELTVMGRDGRIRSKDTIAPGNDPRSIRDREH